MFSKEGPEIINKYVRLLPEKNIKLEQDIENRVTGGK
jgi:hypothetical protein